MANSPSSFSNGSSSRLTAEIEYAEAVEKAARKFRRSLQTAANNRGLLIDEMAAAQDHMVDDNDDHMSQRRVRGRGRGARKRGACTHSGNASTTDVSTDGSNSTITSVRGIREATIISGTDPVTSDRVRASVTAALAMMPPPVRVAPPGTPSGSPPSGSPLAIGTPSGSPPSAPPHRQVAHWQLAHLQVAQSIGTLFNVVG